MQKSTLSIETLPVKKLVQKFHTTSAFLSLTVISCDGGGELSSSCEYYYAE